MAFCTRCNKRAAKRYCPALLYNICAVCCAEDRMIELACPESCPYLHAARESEGKREREMRVRELPAYGQMSSGLREKLVPALVTIDAAIAEAYRELKSADHVSIHDADVAAALDNTIRNLETEDRGIIYEHKALSPLVQELGRRLHTALDELNKRDEELHVLRSEMIKALNLVRDTVRAHLRLAGGGSSESRSYIRHVSLFAPWPAASPPLII